MSNSQGERSPTCFRGLAASGGVVFAPVVRFEAQKDREAPHYEVPEASINAEIARFYTAIDVSRRQLCELAKTTASHASSNEAGIFDSHLMMLEDTFFIDTVVRAVRNQHDNVEWAVSQAFGQMAETMRRMGDDYLRERIADIDDVRNRLVGNLLGDDGQRSIPEIQRPSVVVADNISPSDAVALPRRFIRGLVTEQGSLTAHVTILARALGVPAVVGIGASLDCILTGDEIALDGFNGAVWHLPTDEIKSQILSQTAQQRAALEHRHLLADRPAVTPDGVRVTLFANADHSVGFEGIGEHGAEGIGLYRTEYLWIGLGREPSEEEQFHAYSEVISACRGKPVTLRVLDIGGDKMVGRSHAREANPFLGNRSVRYLLNNPSTFRAQVRAILRASVMGRCELMYPMVTTLEELHACRDFVRKCKHELAQEGIPFAENVPEGVMIEVPSAALMADKLAQACDFFSVGTNDLVQYTLAVDRGNESVAHLYQPFHPVILEMLRMVVRAARKYDIPVCVCGEMASDPMAALLLIGMGIRRLSMSANLIPRVKELVCRMAYFDMQRLIDTLVREDLTSAKQIEARCREMVSTYAHDVLSS